MNILFAHTKVILLRRRRWAALGCLLLAALMLYAVQFPLAAGVSATTRQLPIYCVQRDQKLVSISFDAAWGDVRVRPLGQKGFDFSTEAKPVHNLFCSHYQSSIDF